MDMLSTDTGDGRNFGNLTAISLDLSCEFYRIDDLLVARAAAIVVAQGEGDLVAGGIQILVKQRLGADDHTRDTEAALYRAGLAERIDIQFLFLVGQTLDRLHGLTVHAGQLLYTALGGLAVDEHGTGTAGTLRAAVLDRLKSEFVSQHIHQALVLFGLINLAVDCQRIHDFHLILSRGMYRPRPVSTSLPFCTACTPLKNTSRTEPAVRNPSNGV